MALPRQGRRKRQWWAGGLPENATFAYPGQQPQLDAMIATKLNAIPDGPAKSAGIAYGNQARRISTGERATTPTSSFLTRRVPIRANGGPISSIRANRRGDPLGER